MYLLYMYSLYIRNSYCLNNDGIVYSCLLNASKTIDHGLLFKIVLFKNIPKCVVRLIYNSYVKGSCLILINGIKSIWLWVSHKGYLYGQ